MLSNIMASNIGLLFFLLGLSFIEAAPYREQYGQSYSEKDYIPEKGYRKNSHQDRTYLKDGYGQAEEQGKNDYSSYPQGTSGSGQDGYDRQTYGRDSQSNRYDVPRTYAKVGYHQDGYSGDRKGSFSQDRRAKTTYEDNGRSSGQPRYGRYSTGTSGTKLQGSSGYARDRDDRNTYYGQGQTGHRQTGYGQGQTGHSQTGYGQGQTGHRQTGYGQGQTDHRQTGYGEGKTAFGQTDHGQRNVAFGHTQPNDRNQQQSKAVYNHAQIPDNYGQGKTAYGRDQVDSAYGREKDDSTYGQGQVHGSYGREQVDSAHTRYSRNQVDGSYGNTEEQNGYQQNKRKATYAAEEGYDDGARGSGYGQGQRGYNNKHSYYTKDSSDPSTSAYNRRSTSSSYKGQPSYRQTHTAYSY